LPRRKKIESMKLGPLALHVLPWLTAAALVPALACDPQVGTGYTGEVLFSLHGDVILADPDARDLVPALAFINDSNEYVLISGEVQGQFPSGFRMKITTPPPPSTFIRFAPAGASPPSSLKGEVALGFITVVPRQYPNIVPMLDGSFPDGPFPAADGPWTGQFDQCALSGVVGCVHLSLSCTPASCAGVTDLPIAPAVVAVCSPACADAEQDDALLMQTTCSDDQSCRASFFACTPPGPTQGGFLAADGTLLTCNVLDEQVDPSLRETGYLEYAVPAIRVYYLTETNDFPAIGKFGPGYVIEKELEPATKETWASILMCEANAMVSAGCADSDVPCLFNAYEGAGCPWTEHYRFLPSPISDPLTLTMARRDRGAASAKYARQIREMRP
jgi:hypothetical protein